jgi:hypothetical protein
MKPDWPKKHSGDEPPVLGGGTADAPMIVKQPYVIMFKPEGADTIHTHIYRGDAKIGYKEFGLLACDLVRQVAGAFEVDEDEVWEWVDKERHHPTSTPRRPS